MQSRTSRIRPPRAVVEQVEEYLLSQVGVYDKLSKNVTVPPPPRTRGHVEDLDLRVEIIPPSASEKYSRVEAKYDPTNSVLYVNLLYFEENYEGRELAEALHRVVAHELVHVYQILYTRSRDGDPRADSPTAGLPGLRERTPQYRQETGELLHHRLDDNEFYPRLEDTINAINFVSRRKPNEVANIVSYVVGESSRPSYRSKHLKEPMAWLKDLAKYAPKKYIKAVRKIKNEFPETAKMRVADFFRQVSPPDELSTLSNGTPTGKSTDLKDKGEGSQMPNGDGARNIGRPSPDSPNLKSRNLDRSESYGRKPAEGFDGGYVHDSGSGSARVIPYDSGFANNSSPLRKAGGKSIPTDEKLWSEIQALAKGESSKPVSRGKESVNPVNEGKGFQTFPSAYANGWALAQYKRLGGKWKKQSSEFKMPRKWDKEHCESKSCDDMGFSEKASCRPYKNCYEKSAKRVAHRYLKLSSIPHKFEEVDLKYHTRHERLDVLFFLNLQMQEDDGTSWGGEELGCIQGAVYEWGRSYNFDSPCDYDIGVLQEKAGDRSTSSIYLAFVSESEIYEDFLGQRLGDHLYLGFIRHIWDELKKPFVFAPHYCVPNGSTNPTAKKLWVRLTSKYPSSGKCVLISSRP